MVRVKKYNFISNRWGKDVLPRDFLGGRGGARSCSQVPVEHVDKVEINVN